MAICSILLTFLDKFQDPASALENLVIKGAKASRREIAR
jgi:hypothetical protein